MPPRIADYYRTAAESMRKEVDETSDSDVLGRDLDEWCAYLVDHYGMVPIEIDTTREQKMEETFREYTTRGFDIDTGRGPGQRVRVTEVRVSVPVIPTDTLQTIVKLELATDSYSLTRDYPPFEYNHAAGTVSVTAQPNPEHVKRELDELHQVIQRYNGNIAEHNRQFPAEVARAVKAKRERVASKNKGLDELAAAVGIKLIKKADASTAVPTAVKVRSKVAPVMPPARKPQERPVLDDQTFNAILQLITNQCEQFERTPQAFSQLTEEGLRDVLLSSLNAVFEGAAGGETFRGNGKVDLHLPIARGEVFISEVKFWSGPASLEETVGQLRGRLTWRDSYGVAIMLSRNVRFSDVLKSVEETIPGLPGYIANSLRRIDDHHFVARFSIPADEGRSVVIHILAYSLYSADPDKRTVKR